MSRIFNVHGFRPRGIVALILAVGMVAAFAVPAVAASRPSGPPRQYSIGINAEAVDEDTLRFDVVITNLSTGTAVLGSANVTVPSGFTNISEPLGIGASNSKNWTVTKSGNTFQLRAVGDTSKLSPGERVRTGFFATPPSVAGTYTFASAAKASRDFKGSSTFTLVGTNPVLVVCPGTGGCSATLGSTANAPPDHQTGSVTIGECSGCIITVSETPGDFCSGETLPDDCQSPFVLRFNIHPFYSGEIVITQTCDGSDCPEIVEPECEIECEISIASITEPDFYPYYFTESDSNDGLEAGSVQVIDEFCDGETIFTNCIDPDSQGRLGNGDYQSTIVVSVGSVDPRGGY